MAVNFIYLLAGSAVAESMCHFDDGTRYAVSDKCGDAIYLGLLVILPQYEPAVHFVSE